MSATTDRTAASVTVMMLSSVASRARQFVEARRSTESAFAFSLSAHSVAETEINALTTGVELWRVLGLPMSQPEVRAAVQAVAAYQQPDSGLVADPSWEGRFLAPDDDRLRTGDSFFTMTAVRSLAALGARLPYPVGYLRGIEAEALEDLIPPEAGSHSRYAIGDLAILASHNLALDVPGSDQQWRAICDLVATRQDVPTGLFPIDGVGHPLTPSVNRTFHYLRSTWSIDDHPWANAPAMIDTCLEAAGDPSFYQPDTGIACDDLDLAFVLHGARRHTVHRAADVAEWARATLPSILAVQKEDGGFSFYRNSSMRTHGGIEMSDGAVEGDLWGTLMYLGAIKMMIELAYPGMTAPWRFSAVHPSRSNVIWPHDGVAGDPALG